MSRGIPRGSPAGRKAIVLPVVCRPMRVLVAGATGTLGLPTVRALAAAGHDVVGLVRSPEGAAKVEASGARAAFGDVLDPPSLRAAMHGAEGVVHLAASDRDFERVRVDGGRNLVGEAVRAGVRRFVVGSGYWIFGHHEGTITEESGSDEGGAGRFNLAVERVALAAARPGVFDVVIGRPGMVYGPGAWFARAVRELRDGRYRHVGDGTNRWSPVHPDDAGEAYRALLEHGEPGHVYLVIDDAPIAVREFLSFVADRLGAPPPKPMPPKAQSLLPRDLARAMAANQAASNVKLKGLGWRPRFPTFREGVPDVLHAMGPF